MRSRRRFLAGTVAATAVLAGCTAAPRRNTPARTPTDTSADSPVPGSGPSPGSGPMDPGSGPGGGYHEPGSGPGGGYHDPGSGPMGPTRHGPMGPGSNRTGSGAPLVDPDAPVLNEWFADVPNYRGVMEWTGFDEVRVRVGVGDGFRFGPAAIRVSPGTRVVWEWTGLGGSHNVASDDIALESPYFVDAGSTFEHVFETSGTHRYYCAPHLAVGMKGAVLVADE